MLYGYVSSGARRRPALYTPNSRNLGHGHQMAARVRTSLMMPVSSGDRDLRDCMPFTVRSGGRR
jgi:hypothetical protein